ncbi:hypothetical protein IE53DRAFT_385695, partial [Violaceomyces palustris]
MSPCSFAPFLYPPPPFRIQTRLLASPLLTPQPKQPTWSQDNQILSGPEPPPAPKSQTWLPSSNTTIIHPNLRLSPLPLDHPCSDENRLISLTGSPSTINHAQK